ncbi:cytochrome b, subunit of the bc complex [Legionella oakridgensis ATCC 33761 = DSM 21215]|uniref:Cytochrome b, subunit of the bc complex n=1 Tax=Legionella oakridgensis ATCC 33761 = DSM 21215 TaxID=1268635 RepID=W0BHM4_9GAMM|nr:cytochrome b, subunit of the bc complex [Legionella oakridgensis ATCC 33761 = DSM 21215]
MGGYFLEHANFSPANPLTTPEHIAPVWYMTPFYAMLRAVPDKFFGVLVMMGAILILFLYHGWTKVLCVRCVIKAIFQKVHYWVWCLVFYSGLFGNC